MSTECKCPVSRIQKDIVVFGEHCCVDGGGRGKTIDLQNTYRQYDSHGNLIMVEMIRCLC